MYHRLRWEKSYFHNKFLINKISGCWVWIGSFRPNGYGRIKTNGKYYLAHRAVYEVFSKKIPKDFTLDHLCRRKSCVNPKHLEIVSIKENILRGYSPSAINARKSRCSRGHPFNKQNTYKWNGRRKCRTCSNRRSYEYLIRKKNGNNKARNK